MSSGSKFSSIIQAHRERSQPEAPSEASEEIAEEPITAAPQAPATPRRQKKQPSPAPSGRGRPAGGKRSDPDFTQVTAYVREDTYRNVKIALLEDRGKEEFSDLVELLLTNWLRTRKSKNANT